MKTKSVVLSEYHLRLILPTITNKNTYFIVPLVLKSILKLQKFEEFDLKVLRISLQSGNFPKTVLLNLFCHFWCVMGVQCSSTCLIQRQPLFVLVIKLLLIWSLSNKYLKWIIHLGKSLYLEVNQGGGNCIYQELISR